MHNFPLNFRFILQKTSWPPKVSCVGDLSGHKRRLYRCLHWLAAYKAHQKKVKYIVSTSTLVHFLSYTLRPFPLLLKFNVRTSSMDVGSSSLDIGCSSNDSKTHVQILVGCSSNNYNITFIIHNYKQYNILYSDEHSEVLVKVS